MEPGRSVRGGSVAGIEPAAPPPNKPAIALAFAPDLVVERYLRLVDPPDVEKGEETAQEGAVLFIDTSGFTKMSERLSPEEVALVMNSLFGRMIAIVHEHRGDVLKFLGDALLCAFCEEPATAALRAVACGMAIQAGVASLGRAAESAAPLPNAPSSRQLSSPHRDWSTVPAPLLALFAPAERAASPGPGFLTVRRGMADTLRLDTLRSPPESHGTMRGGRRASEAQSSEPHEDSSPARLQVKIGIGLGRFYTLHVGGVGGRWEFLVTGPALSASLLAEGAAEPSQTIVTRDVHARLPEGCCRAIPLSEDEGNTVPLPFPEAGDLLLRVLEFTPPPSLSLRPRDWRRPAALAAMDAERQEQLRSLLEAYVPTSTALKRLYQGQPELLLAENRTASVLFIGLVGLETAPDEAYPPDGGPASPGSGLRAAPRPALASLHAAVRAVQGALAAHEGALRQVVSDDKGSVLLGAFGLPGTGHGYADDAARAVETALEAKRLLEDLDLECSVGVTTGRVFCGLVGDASSVHRAEYAMVGSVVNKAARLMAKAGKEVVVDEATHAATAKLFKYRELPAVHLKGIAEPVKLFQPTRHRDRRMSTNMKTGMGLDIAAMARRASHDVSALLLGEAGPPPSLGPRRASLGGAAPHHPHARSPPPLDGTEAAAAAAALEGGYEELDSADALPGGVQSPGSAAGIFSPVAGRRNRRRANASKASGAGPTSVSRGVSSAWRLDSVAAAMSGRAPELETIRAALAAAAGTGEGAEPSSRVVLIEAEAGMGKSRVVREVCRSASDMGFKVVCGGASEMERATPYLQWRTVLLVLFRAEGDTLPAGGGATSPSPRAAHHRRLADRANSYNSVDSVEGPKDGHRSRARGLRVARFAASPGGGVNSITLANAAEALSRLEGIAEAGPAEPAVALRPPPRPLRTVQVQHEGNSAPPSPSAAAAARVLAGHTSSISTVNAGSPVPDPPQPGAAWPSPLRAPSKSHSKPIVGGHVLSLAPAGAGGSPAPNAPPLSPPASRPVSPTHVRAFSRATDGSGGNAAAAAAAVAAALHSASSPPTDAAGHIRLAEARILELLPPDLAPKASLLNELLDLRLPDSPLVAEMTAELRAENVLELVRALLRGAVRSPTLIVLEDGHWADSASNALTRAVAAAAVPGLAMVVTSRTEEEAGRAALARLAAGDGAGRVRVTLGPLTKEETCGQVRDRLAGAEPPEELVAFLYAKAQGRPLFTEELLNMMLEKGAVRVIEEEEEKKEEGGGPAGQPPPNGKARVVFDAQSTESGGVLLDLPDSLQGVIVARVDRLESSQQLALKVASVLGRVFDSEVLWRCYPMAVPRDALLDDLDRLVDSDFVQYDDEAADADGALLGVGAGQSFVFKHQLVVDVAYRLLLKSQAQAVHARVGAFIEEQYGREDAAYFALLAHHWEAAEDFGRAVEYLSKGAEEAARAHAGHEVIALASRALARAPREYGAGPKARLALRLGEAYFATGSMQSCRDHLEACLALLGRSFPRSVPGLGFGVLRQVMVQAVRRVSPHGPCGRRRFADPAASTAVGAYDALAQCCFLQGDVEGQLLAMLTALNLAERLGAAVDLARAFANAAATCAVVKLFGMARKYLQRARDALALTGDRNLSAYSYICLCACMVHYCSGEWEELVKVGEDGFGVAQRLGYMRREGELCSVTGSAEIQSRAPLSAPRARFRSILELASARGDSVVQGWAYAELLDMGAMTGDLEVWRRELRPFQALMSAGKFSGYPRLQARIAVVTGEERLARGDAPAALSALQGALALLGPLRQTEPYALQMHLTLCFLALRVWIRLRAEAPANGRLACQFVTRAERLMAQYARAFILGDGPLAFVRGVRLYYEGVPPASYPTDKAGEGAAAAPPPASDRARRRAAAAFEEAARGARRRGLAVVEGLALSALGAAAADPEAEAAGGALLAAKGVLRGWSPLLPYAAYPLAGLGRVRENSVATSGSLSPMATGPSRSTSVSYKPSSATPLSLALA